MNVAVSFSINQKCIYWGISTKKSSFLSDFNPVFTFIHKKHPVKRLIIKFFGGNADAIALI